LIFIGVVPRDTAMMIPRRPSPHGMNLRKKQAACIGVGLGAAASGYLSPEALIPSNFVASVQPTAASLRGCTQRLQFQNDEKVIPGTLESVVPFKAPHLPSALQKASADRGAWISGNTVAPILLAAGALTIGCRHSEFKNKSTCSHVVLKARSSSTDEDESWLNEITAPLLLLVLAVLYGANVPLLKEVETEAPLDLTAPEVLLLRFVTASTLTLPWLVFNFRKAVTVWRPALELSFWLCGGYALQLIGLEKTSASVAAITTALVGVTVQTLQVVIGGRPVKPLVVASSLGTIAGLLVFVSAPGTTQAGAINSGSLVDKVLNVFDVLASPPRPLPHEALLQSVPGEALAVMGAIFFGVHVWRCNGILEAAESEHSSADKDYELALAIVQCTVTTLFCLLLSMVDSPYSLQEQLAIAERLSPTVWLQIAACGVLCTGLPSVLELFAFKVVTPEVSSLIYCTIPLWGAVLGVVFLHDGFGPQSLFGGAIILLSSLMPSIVGVVAEEDKAGMSIPCVSSEEARSADSNEEVVLTKVEEEEVLLVRK